MVEIPFSQFLRSVLEYSIQHSLHYFDCVYFSNPVLLYYFTIREFLYNYVMRILSESIGLYTQDTLPTGKKQLLEIMPIFICD
jgi:hypothetical protein